MPTLRSRAVLCLVTLSSLACGGSDGGPSGPQPAIVFVSRRATGYPNIWIMDANGGGQHALTSVSNEEIAPALSPDGKTVAFLTKRYTAYNQLAVLDLASGKVTRVLVDSVAHGAPTWSPDGEWIAFDRSFNACCDLGGFHKIHPDGSGLALIAHVGGDPSWSPDGNTIVHGGVSGVFLLDVGTGHDTLLVSGNSERPVWSPSGTQVAFGCSPGLSAICVINANGTGIDTITVPGLSQAHPGWSMDGSWVYAARNIDNTGFATNWEIYRFHADGSGAQRLTTNGDASGGALDDWPAGGVAAP